MENNTNQNNKQNDKTKSRVMIFYIAAILLLVSAGIYILFIITPQVEAKYGKGVNSSTIRMMTVLERVELSLEEKGYSYKGTHCSDVGHDWLSRGGFIKAATPQGEEKTIFWRYDEWNQENFVFEEIPGFTALKNIS